MAETGTVIDLAGVFACMMSLGSAKTCPDLRSEMVAFTT